MTLRDEVRRAVREFSAFSDEAEEARETAIAYAERELAEQRAAAVA